MISVSDGRNKRRRRRRRRREEEVTRHGGVVFGLEKRKIKVYI